MNYIEDAFKIYTDSEFAGLPKDTIVEAMTLQARDAFYNGDGKEVRDEMLLREARRLINAGQLHIAIDDGEGGTPVMA